jgi:hypothetical protein
MLITKRTYLKRLFTNTDHYISFITNTDHHISTQPPRTQSNAVPSGIQRLSHIMQTASDKSWVYLRCRGTQNSFNPTTSSSSGTGGVSGGRSNYDTLPACTLKGVSAKVGLILLLNRAASRSRRSIASRPLIYSYKWYSIPTG